MTPRARGVFITAALVCVAMVWGGTFVVVKGVVERYPMYAFLWWRFALASVAFVLLFPSTLRRLTPRVVRVGFLAGLLLAAGYVFQTWGLMATSASKAAFITGMFVVITPLMQTALLRRPPRGATVVGVLLAVVGLYLLSGGGTGGWNAGDTRVLLCAVAYSAHMIVLGGPGRGLDVRAFTFVQLVTVAVLTGAIALATERAPIPSGAALIVAIVVTGVFGSAVAFAIQTYAQRHLSPAKTALVLTTEPAFGGLFGYLAGEALGWRGLAGAALILAGMLVSEVSGTLRGRHTETPIEVAIEGPPVAME